MARRYYRRREKTPTKEEAIFDIVARLVVLTVIWFSALYFADRDKFWRYSIWCISLVVGLIVLWLVGVSAIERKRKNHFSGLLKDIDRLNLGSEIGIFINQWGIRKHQKNNWEYRGHSFEQERLSDFTSYLKGKGVGLKDTDDLKNIFERSIQEKEQGFLKDSLSVPANGISEKKPLIFSALSGPDFEKLLVRLFEAMGYKAQLIGGVGDQGGDLIAVKDGERLMIQAKRYTGTVGNSAIQEAAAAKNHYACTKALVMTTGYYTDEAIALAKTNNVELVFKKRLKELLSTHLKENWE